MRFELADCQNALVLGAGHGIGLALVKDLLQNSKAKIICIYRQREKAAKLFELDKENPGRLDAQQTDATSEEDMERTAARLIESGLKLDLVIVCAGLLHNDRISPEKSIKDFNSNAYLEVMRVNTLPFAFAAKHFGPLLGARSPSALVALSAKVGSIEDNRMGGWHSYRASKAALNMLVKNVAIEFDRNRRQCLVLALHPGTTETELSAPYIANTSYIIHPPEQTARNLLNLIAGRSLSETGSFLSWDNKRLPW